MAEITLSKGKAVALVDDSDFSWLNRWIWSLSGRYAKRVGRKEDGDLRGRSILMHRQILGVRESKVFCDHVNHEGLDNRRVNLRVCSQSQNQGNSRLCSDSSSGYKGVYFVRVKALSKPWKAQVAVDKRIKHLGYFHTKEQAALAYNEAALNYFGEFACLNEVPLC